MSHEITWTFCPSLYQEAEANPSAIIPSRNATGRSIEVVDRANRAALSGIGARLSDIRAGDHAADSSHVTVVRLF